MKISKIITSRISNVQLSNVYSIIAAALLGLIPFFQNTDISTTISVTIYSIAIIIIAFIFLSENLHNYLLFSISFSICILLYYFKSNQAYSYALSSIYALTLCSTLICLKKINSIKNNAEKLLTESRNTTRKTKREKERVIFLNKERTRFIANASHDLKQPLHSLGLYLDAINEKPNKKERAEVVAQSKNALQTLDDLFSSLLDLSNIDAGEVSISPLHIELYKLFSNIKNELQQLASKSNFEIETRVHPELITFCDPILFSRCLRNIIINAINHSEGSKIQLIASPQKNNILISIIDNGKGISKKDHELIFEEFKQLNTQNNDKNNGLGLGLSIVKKLFQLQGHNFQIDSTIGKGTTFKINIPFGNSEYVSDLLNSPTKTNKVTFKKSILVIEDNQEILEATGLLFKQWKQEVFLSTSVEGALKLITSGFTPDIIISDYKLENNTTGLDAINALKESLSTNTQIVFISGETSAKKIKDIRSNGYPLLHKPLRPATLESILTRLHDNPEYGCLIK